MISTPGVCAIFKRTGAVPKILLDLQVARRCRVPVVKVSELAQRAGVAPSAVRWYESVGILPPAARQANGYREYADEDLARLRLVLSLRRLGLGPEDAGRMARLCLEHGEVDRDLAPLIADQRRAIARQRDDLDRLDGELIDLEATIAAAGRARGNRKERTMPDTPIRVLFVCTGNSARSQIAEAVLGRLGGPDFEVYSAGTEPKGVNPYSIRVLADAGHRLVGCAQQVGRGVPRPVVRLRDHRLRPGSPVLSGLPGRWQLAPLGARGSGRGRGHRCRAAGGVQADVPGTQPADPPVRRGRPARRRSPAPRFGHQLKADPDGPRFVTPGTLDISAMREMFRSSRRVLAVPWSAIR